MQGPDEYEMDEGLMDELGGVMDEHDSKKFMPVVQVTVSVSKEGEPKTDTDQGAEPTPEEMDELQKALG